MHDRLRSLFVLVCACFQLVACSRPPVSVSPNAPILKIAVMANGRITVDGSPATIDSLRVSLKRLAEQKGIVWYYRESGEAKAAIGHFTCNIEEISLGQDFPVR